MPAVVDWWSSSAWDSDDDSTVAMGIGAESGAATGPIPVGA
jgi:hypothetical protein